ncbi:MAG TPA: ATP-binding cassette domain-containing protein [Bryobacteraceae bacterium]|nr:ATP-binding cassette domain-containing protein [Bryobacteraceae bacterium]
MIQARIARKIPPGFSLDIEFQAGAGVTALYGPAGAGKSLILDAIAGFAPLDSGRILLDDVLLFDAAAGVSVPARLRNCGYVSRDGSLFPHLSVRQNLMFAALRRPRLERHRRVAEMLERFQLTSAATLAPPRLTAAQKYACAIARALLADPRALLLDDPDRRVDESLLRRIRDGFDGPILLATQELDLCCAAAAEMVVLDAGRVLQRGAPREILLQPDSVEVARLVGIPNLFEGVIAALDPGRKSSRLELAEFELTGPYFPGHFRGDRVWLAIRAEDLRVHSAAAESIANLVAAQLLHVSERSGFIRLEFAGGIFADLSREEFERQRDNKGWQVEFPPHALRIL